MSERPRVLETAGPGILEEAKREAQRWAAIPTASLVGLIGMHSGSVVRDAASAELARRQAASVTEATMTMTAAIEKFDHAASIQTGTVITLTTRLLRWTWILGGIALLQLAVMIWDLFGPKGGA